MLGIGLQLRVSVMQCEVRFVRCAYGPCSVRQMGAASPLKEQETSAQLCSICERHFLQEFIEDTYVNPAVINGQVVVMKRQKLRLKPDAIPTVFPEYPSY